MRRRGNIIYVGSRKIRRQRSKGTGGNSSTKCILGRKDTYLKARLTTSLKMFFDKEVFEMGPGE